MNGRLLIVDGWTRPCRISIELQQGDANGLVMVTVKDKLTVSIYAHYVEHGPFRKTRTTPSMLRDMIDLATGILEPQANVRISLDRELTLTHKEIGKALGRTVLSAKGSKRDEWDLVTKHAVPTSDPNVLNLFLVQRFDAPGESEPRAETDKGCTIFEDNFDRDRAGQTLAHEVCHHLGIKYELKGANEENRLMYWKDGGKRLTADEADMINRKGVPVRP
jgi:hypothetical protein